MRFLNLLLFLILAGCNGANQENVAEPSDRIADTEPSAEDFGVSGTDIWSEGSPSAHPSAVEEGGGGGSTIPSAPPYNPDETPYRTQWGAYTVTVEQANPSEAIPVQTLTVQDEAGQMIREVQDGKILEIKFIELTGEGSTELFITGHDLGAHCCGTSYIFSQDQGLQNLLVFKADSGHVDEFKDLDKDHRPEIIATKDSLAYFDDLPYSESPVTTTVLGWNGNRYVDQTTRFPEVTKRLILKYQQDFRAIEEVEGTINGQDAEVSRRAAALGFYANALIAGEEAQARAWLIEHAPKTTREWLELNEEAIRVATTRDDGKVRVSQQRVFSSRGY